MLAPSLQPAISHSFLSVETIDSMTGFTALREEWNQLLRSSGSDCLFLTWEWLHTWWTHLAGDRTLAIVVVRKNGRLEALAPLCRVPFDLSRGRPFSTLEFLGSGHAGSDYLDVIVLHDAHPEALDLLARACADRGVAMEWTQLRLGHMQSERVAERLNARGWTTRTSQTNVCPYLPLKGWTFEQYLSSLGGEHRYSFQRKLRRLQRDFTLRLEQPESLEECQRSLEHLIQMHNVRWSQRGGSNAFHTRALLAFHRAWILKAFGNGWLRLYCLRLNDTPAAFVYGFLYGGVLSFYQAAFHARFAKYGVGMVMIGMVLREAFEEGADEFDFLHGDEEYKSHWSRASRPIGRLEMFAPHIRGRLERVAVDTARGAKVMLHKVLRRNLT